ncbi:hypothetical protein SKAU_G00125300 [Synaphobranchus kaupii]|uniref:Uncharacterized protein n=1 Tax=Synaphobranchus kaupii TaxID=118154 RepID=A0A9Q1FPK1_SYNKA|nr:hypothetical protein SKAU_G00125300 [Synaphobranchus kaupii]
MAGCLPTEALISQSSRIFSSAHRPVEAVSLSPHPDGSGGVEDGYSLPASRQRRPPGEARRNRRPCGRPRLYRRRPNSRCQKQSSKQTTSKASATTGTAETARYSGTASARLGPGGAPPEVRKYGRFTGKVRGYSPVS